MREAESGTRAGSDLERRYPVALAIYGILGVVAWFTIGEGHVMVYGRQVEFRWFPILILGLFAFRTVMAMQADRIRHGGK
jgi:hypothetical protein